MTLCKYAFLFCAHSRNLTPPIISMNTVKAKVNRIHCDPMKDLNGVESKFETLCSFFKLLIIVRKYNFPSLNKIFIIFSIFKHIKSLQHFLAFAMKSAAFFCKKKNKLKLKIFRNSKNYSLFILEAKRVKMSTNL